MLAGSPLHRYGFVPDPAPPPKQTTQITLVELLHALQADCHIAVAIACGCDIGGDGMHAAAAAAFWRRRTRATHCAPLNAPPPPASPISRSSRDSLDEVVAALAADGAFSLAVLVRRCSLLPRPSINTSLSCAS